MTATARAWRREKYDFFRAASLMCLPPDDPVNIAEA
jgi:hypothetical protein